MIPRIIHSFRHLLRRLHQADRGTVAVTFLLSLPILLTIIAIIIQYALISTARLTLDRALAAAARSAMTTLPTNPVNDNLDAPAMIKRSALMNLEAISPRSPVVNLDAGGVWSSLRTAGINVPDDYPARYSYADAATTVTIQPLAANDVVLFGSPPYYQQTAPRARITISYEFLLTVPAANHMVGHDATIAGVSGRYLTITASYNVQLSPGREANSTMWAPQ
jgi:Flp pilus assembly protein TadG